MGVFRQIRTLGLYFLIPGIGAVTPLLIYPALTSRFGEDGFASVAIAQSIGSAGAVIAELGWGVLGPQRVARADRAGRALLYEAALATKCAAAMVIAPLAAMATGLIVTEHHGASAVLAFATVSLCLSPSWFLVGANRPMTILFTEGVPRTGLLAATAAAIALGAPLALYGIATLFSVLLTQVLVARVAGQRLLPRLDSLRQGRSAIREQLPLTVGRMVSVLYTSLPTAILGILNPGAVAVFAASERLMRMGLSVLGGVPSRLQSWVGIAEGADRRRRSRQSILMNTGLGLVAALGFTLLAPWVATFVFAGEIRIPFEIAALSAVVMLTICVSRGFGLSMVAEGRANWIAAANIGAAIVGVVAILALSAPFGAHGALLGELASEVVGLVVQAFILYVGHRFLGYRDLRGD